MQHQMELVQTLANGVEEWRCPDCQRQFLLQWEPYKKIVLNEGDAYVTHSGAKGGVQLRAGVQKSEQIISDDLSDALGRFWTDFDADQ